MRAQFIVQESNKTKREEFYNYINETFDLDICYPYDKELFIKSNFPFVIDFKEHSLWICESIACCACAAGAKLIISINEFKNQLDNNQILNKKIKKYVKIKLTNN